MAESPKQDPAAQGGDQAQQDRHKALEALQGAHVFPGPFTFKAIGSPTAEFVAAVLQAAVTVLGPATKPEVTTRLSAQGRHQAVHLATWVQSAEEVLQIYAALRDLPGLAMLL